MEYGKSIGEIKKAAEAQHVKDFGPSGFGGGCSIPTQPTKAPESLQDLLGRLDGQLTEIDSAIDYLAQRLEPVLTPAKPAADSRTGGEGGPLMVEASPTVERVRLIHRRNSMLLRYLGELIGRLEL